MMGGDQVYQLLIAATSRYVNWLPSFKVSAFIDNAQSKENLGYFNLIELAGPV
jgi:hypothetical protein